MKQAKKMNYCLFIVFGLLLFSGCSKEEPIEPEPDPGPTPVTPKDTTSLDDGPVDFSLLTDTYGHLASESLADQWAHYNVHDPSYLVEDDFTYCYNTDVAFGHDVRPGIQIRRSINLVEWEFVGWAFPRIPTLGSNFIIQKGGTPNEGIWAPYIMKVGEEYRLYYSLSSNVGRLSVIGLATASDPKGPFREQGLAVTSEDNATIQTNAIDPTVVVDKNGGHWMYYGSAWDGIYKLELNPETGLAMRNEDKGVRVAQRGFTGNKVNGNIEGPEIIYNEEFDQYYLFLSYDWLQTKYNVRVGRSQNPTGPFYDYLGNDMNVEKDDLPMILAPYRFAGHSGWQGVSHPGIFKKDGRFYIGHQGRPGVNSFYMVMHVRQVFWTPDGWPVVSSQRYAAEEETLVSREELTGAWEQIVFDYRIVPGYAEEQILPDFSDSETLTLDGNGMVSGGTKGAWTYDAPRLSIQKSDGTLEQLFVERGRDWENEVDSTILFTGLNNNAIAVWGKKIK